MKKIISIVIAITTFSALGFFAQTAVHALMYSPDDVTFAAPTTTQKKSAPKNSVIVDGDYPVRLNIPSLHINAAVQQVAINSKGNVSSPSNFTDVGWYAFGTRPGEVGS